MSRLIASNVPRIDGQPIALAGGVFANVKLNKLVKEMGFGKIFVQPAMGDGGLAFGGPLMALAEERGSLAPYRLEHVYLGPDYDDAAIERALRAANLPVRRFDAVEPEIARLLADGRVVARFNGRMEFGPRALGNRSILYHCSDPDVNDWLNKRLERTEFMPFAPATIEDEADESFLGLAGAEHAAEFMTIIFDCTRGVPRAAARPRCTWTARRARSSCARRRTRPSTASSRSTGSSPASGTVVNTSFNMHEEPIVCSPEDAVRAFLLGHLDYLAIGNYIVENPRLEPVVGTPPRRLA